MRGTGERRRGTGIEHHGTPSMFQSRMCHPFLFSLPLQLVLCHVWRTKWYCPSTFKINIHHLRIHTSPSLGSRAERRQTRCTTGGGSDRGIEVHHPATAETRSFSLGDSGHGLDIGSCGEVNGCRCRGRCALTPRWRMSRR